MSDRFNITFAEDHPDPIFITDQNGFFLDVNFAFESMTGYSASELGLLDVGRLVMEPEAEKLNSSLAKAFAGEPQSLETAFLAKNKSVVYLLLTVAPVGSTDGTNRVFAILKDVTRLKEAEKQYGECKASKRLVNEKHFEEIIDKSPQSIIIHIEYKIVYANLAALDLIGADSLEEILGKNILNLVHSENLEDVKQRISQNMERSAPVEEKLVCLNGKIIDVTVMAAPVTYNGQPARQVLYRDITKQKIMERALRQSEYRLAQAQKIADLGSWEFDPQSNASYWSEQLFHITGLVPHEGSIQQQEILQYIHPDDLESYLHFIEELKAGKPCEHVYRIIRTDGEVRVVRSICTFNENGRMFGVLHDITEQKRTEEMLRRSEKLAVLGELAAGVGHEIRNPLTALKGFLQLLQMKVDGHDHYFSIMQSEIERINSIVSELMYLAKPEAVQFKSVDIRKTIRELVTLLETEAAVHSILLDLSMDDDLPMVTCIEKHMKQVLMNLIKNAIEAMPKGGKIDIKVRREGEELILTCRDQGCGISAERIPKLGEPFYSTKEKGNGLGLLISHRIIENHKGRIRITSELGVGTAIDVILPL